MTFILMVWGWLKSPLGKQIALWGSLVALLLGFGQWRYHDGVKHEKAAWDARVSDARERIKLREGEAAKITDQHSTDLTQTKVEIRERTVIQIQKVPVYVTAKADAQCVVPVGFISLWNEAAAGRDPGVPSPAGGPLEAPSGVQLSQVLTGDLTNFGVAYAWRAEALTWRSWYSDQAAAWNKK